MSNFACPKCNTIIMDAPGKGFITGCPHFPIEKKSKTPEMPEFMREIFNFKK